MTYDGNTRDGGCSTRCLCKQSGGFCDGERTCPSASEEMPFCKILPFFFCVLSSTSRYSCQTAASPRGSPCPPTHPLASTRTHTQRANEARISLRIRSLKHRRQRVPSSSRPGARHTEEGSSLSLPLSLCGRVCLPAWLSANPIPTRTPLGASRTAAVVIQSRTRTYTYIWTYMECT